jgi:hypothetical protein
MYPADLDAFHEIYLDRSKRAIAAAEARRHTRSARRGSLVLRLRQVAQQLTVGREQPIEPQPGRVR